MLLQLAIGAALFLGVGAIAARAERNEALAKRVAGVAFLIVLAVLVLTIARGELLRFSPAASDGEQGIQTE